MPGIKKSCWVFWNKNGEVYNPESDTWEKFTTYNNCIPVRMTYPNAIGHMSKVGGSDIVKVRGRKGNWEPEKQETH